MLRVCLPAQLIREKYWEYGYEEVVTPNLFNFELWERSGHAEHYKDNMFLVDIEKQEFGLKPMNCPGTMLLHRWMRAALLHNSSASETNWSEVHGVVMR